MEQVSSTRITKENPAATAMATGSKKPNTHEGLSPMRIAVRNFPAYSQRSQVFAALMNGARR
jgi:hypothetical protein